MPTIADYREEMIAAQLERWGIVHERVLGAMRTVPRHEFVPEVRPQEAYADHPLPIGERQTISQPYMVARMTELLDPAPLHRVLEIGAGSGYQSAVLAQLCAEVHAVERIPSLSRRGLEAVTRLGYSNIRWYTGDGTVGLPDAAPFDGILVAAGAPEVPAPLLAQLTDGGRLVVPVGQRHTQELQVITRRGASTEVRRDTLCRFVDLIGQHGW